MGKLLWNYCVAAEMCINYSTVGHFTKVGHFVIRQRKIILLVERFAKVGRFVRTRELAGVHVITELLK